MLFQNSFLKLSLLASVSFFLSTVPEPSWGMEKEDETLPCASSRSQLADPRARSSEEKEEKGDTEDSNINSRFKKLLQEKAENYEKERLLFLTAPQMPSMETYLRQSNGNYNAAMDAMLEDHLEAKRAIDAKHALILLQRREIDKELPQAFFELCRQRETEYTHALKASLLRGSEKDSAQAFPTESLNIGKMNVIPVPDVIAINVRQTFYAHYNSDKELWYGLELLQPTNAGWWQERLGWEATMQFGKHWEQEFPTKLIGLTDLGSSISLDTLIEESFFIKPIQEDLDPLLRLESDFEIMALRPTSVEDSPTEFKKAYENYMPSREQYGNYLAALRGFKGNLDRYTVTPTWVAFVSSEKIEAPLYRTLPSTSPVIKMATTVTQGGPFYSPLGIYSSPIARASDSKPFSHLSLSLHAYVAKQMGEIDPGIKYMITRPLSNMEKIFNQSGLPFSSSFGDSLSADNLPVILRPGAYEGPDQALIPFYNAGGMNSFVLYDARTRDAYQIGRKHPFSTNYYLGGIFLGGSRGVQFPFVTFDRETLANKSPILKVE